MHLIGVGMFGFGKKKREEEERQRKEAEKLEQQAKEEELAQQKKEKRQADNESAFKKEKQKQSFLHSIKMKIPKSTQGIIELFDDELAEFTYLFNEDYALNFTFMHMSEIDREFLKNVVLITEPRSDIFSYGEMTNYATAVTPSACELFKISNNGSNWYLSKMQDIPQMGFSVSGSVAEKRKQNNGTIIEVLRRFRKLLNEEKTSLRELTEAEKIVVKNLKVGSDWLSPQEAKALGLTGETA